jgi:hypothetical protein
MVLIGSDRFIPDQNVGRAGKIIEHRNFIGIA